MEIARPAVALYLFLAFGSVSALAAAFPSKLTELSGRAMGTTWSVKFEQPGVSLDLAQVERAVADRLEALEQQFSTYRPNSALSRFNAAQHTDWFPVGPELAQLAAMSRDISTLTGGAFDVTVQPLVRLWGFGSVARSGSIPATHEIAAARELVDWRQLEVRMNPPALRKARPEIAADFSSMGKGFAADVVSELLVGLRAPNHLVRIGGDLKSGGTPTGDRGWQVGVEQPLADAPAVACVVELQGQALSTSGNYRNFFEAEGRRYGHIIDPRTGEPVTGSLVAVSVVHASCAQSSALATALFVLGAEEGFRLATRKGLACLFFARGVTGVESLATPAFKAVVRNRE